MNRSTAFLGVLGFQMLHITLAFAFADPARRTLVNTVAGCGLNTVLLGVGLWAFSVLRRRGTCGPAIGVNAFCAVGLVVTLPILIAHANRAVWWVLVGADCLYLAWSVWSLWLPAQQRGGSVAVIEMADPARTVRASPPTKPK